MSMYQTQITDDFDSARQRAFLKRVRALLFGHPDKLRLLSFDEVKRTVGCSAEAYIGQRTVPVSAIIGSVGRYQDFDREFLPVRRSSRQRWQNIDKAYYENVSLPAVQLYKVGDVYFVKDGNHRVSVAREHGVAFIDAEVIECQSKVAVTADLRAEDLETMGEYAAFLKWSELDRLRPDQSIHFTVPGGYQQLREHISVHLYFLGLERKAPVSTVEAVASWYDHVYMPVIHLIREDHVLDKFPGRTEADLYLWIMDHLYFLRERDSDGVDTEEAVVDFRDHFGRVSLLEAIRRRITARTEHVERKEHEQHEEHECAV
jgi:hypothetical protein